MQNLTLLKVTKLIIHELPKRASPGVGILSDNESPLSQEVRHFFEEQIRRALSTVGIPIGFAPGASSPVPDLVTKLLTAPRVRFVPTSQDIAKHLFTLQTAVHSEGLLCVAKCQIGSSSGLAVIKLELEEGVRAELKGTNGKQHFEIQIIDDLMLTKNTRVFKVALFTLDNGKKATAIEGKACDNQRARTQLLAGYFLDDFLGCVLLDEPDVTTKKFMDASEGFINALPDPMTQARYQTALIAEMNSNALSISARTFADAHFDVADRRPYLKALTDADVPIATFGKDVTLVRNKIARIRFEFEGDVSVHAPPDRMKDTVTLQEKDGGKTRLSVEARLNHVQGSR